MQNITEDRKENKWIKENALLITTIHEHNGGDAIQTKKDYECIKDLLRIMEYRTIAVHYSRGGRRSSRRNADFWNIFESRIEILVNESRTDLEKVQLT